MKTNFNLCLLTLALAGLPGFAQAQGTAIGYQGRLNDGALPATGLYDFTFNVFDVEVEGVALATTVILDAVPVTNGLFNVALDFGPGIFTGAARWLEITVRTNGVGDPTGLTPRTPLLPTPYSILAGGVANGTVTPDQLNTGGPPTPGQFLSYDGGNFLWSDPDVLAGNVWSVLNNNAYYNAGNVGIGINSPASKLTVSAAGYGIEHTDGTRRLNTYVSASGGWLGTLSNDPLNFFVNGGGSSLTVTTGGRVGIGTTTPAGKLTVRTTGAFSAYGIEHTDDTVRLSTFLDGSGGWLGTRTGHALNFYVNDGLPSLAVDATGNTVVTPNGGSGGYGSTIFGTPNGESGMSIRGANRADVRFDGVTLKLVAAPNVGPPSSFNGVAVHTSGNVGIGTLNPQTKLHVETPGGAEATIKGASERAILSLDSTLNGQNRVWTLESGLFGSPGLFGIYDRNSGRGRLTIDTNGVVGVDVLQIRGGADLSEHFDIQSTRAPGADGDRIEPGMVARIDPENPGKLVVSSQAYDRRVAGIISGAGGVKPGMLMSQAGSIADGAHPVALTGRVYCFVDATQGAVMPGDLLTTSDTPGHAMKVTDHGKAQGAILGKAMSGLREGKGMVLVLVTLQ